MFSLKRKRGMAGERENRILESPLWLFVRTRWIEWEQEIHSMQVDDSEFLLYLVWALDTIKEQDERTLRNFRGRVYGAIRKKSIERSFAAPKEDIDYVSNLVCACGLFCYGLTLTESDDNRREYSELVGGMMDCWPAIRGIKNSIEIDENNQALKDWMVEYMKDDEYFTLSDVIEWDDGHTSVLPDIIGRRNRILNVTINNNIEKFENQKGAVFNDNSTTQILTEYGEDRKLLQ